jgi:hypothetical protein
MSTSSSSPPSTRHTRRGGASHLRSSHAFCQRCIRRPWHRRPQGYQCTPASAAPQVDGQLPDDGPQGGDQPPSRWRGQSHHHRAQPREAPRHQGPQPKKRLRPACNSGCAPSCTCTSPPGSPGVWGGGGHSVGPTPAYGDLAIKVTAPHTREVRWDGQLKVHVGP